MNTLAARGRGTVPARHISRHAAAHDAQVRDAQHQADIAGCQRLDRRWTRQDHPLHAVLVAPTLPAAPAAPGQPRQLHPHGTMAAARRHERAREPLCPACQSERTRVRAARRAAAA